MPSHPETPEATVSLRAHLEEAFDARRPEAAVDAALEAVRHGLPVEDLYRRVLVPLMTETGSRWHEGRLRIWEEHLESAAVRSIVECVRDRVREARERSLAEHGDRQPRAALFACPAQEWHVLSLRMLADRFAMRGWRTYYLGADVPDPEIVDAARTLEVDLVVVTAATHYERLFLRDMIEGLRRKLSDVRLLVTGPAFTGEERDWPPDTLLDPDAIPDPYA